MRVRQRLANIAPMRYRRGLLPLLACACLAMASCSARAGTTLHLRTLNGSGVSGSVLLTPLSSDRTRVEVNVDPAGNLDMPAHIHPGTCDELTPQPKYPLTNVVNGHSVTEVAASLEDLFTGTVALNLHQSNAEMGVYTACVELVQTAS